MLAGILTCCLLTSGSTAWGQDSKADVQKQAEPFSPEQVRFFEEDVLPILKASCFACHGGEPRIKGGLRLTSREGVLKGGEVGPIVDLEKPSESRLLAAINYRELEMPPSGKLKPEQIDILTKWVESGLAWSDSTADYGVPPEAEPAREGDGRDYWAYQPIVSPEVPRVAHAEWVHNPIDAFLVARLESQGLESAPPAGALSLIRRVYYDLTGLPPTPEEADAFVRDPSDKAYDALLDRLLASPQYGEHWGRHWLDLVRYAETNGYERDSPKPEAWRYRDYVIHSLNEDKPYDQFVREQIAGDELGPLDAERLSATGFYRLGLCDDEPADRLQARYDGLDDVLKTTSEAILGMSLGCARCHDHKRDPISQRDYYSLLAFIHDISPMNGANLRRLSSDEEARDHERLVREKQEHEARLHAEAYKLEQTFRLAWADKHGSEVVKLMPSDLQDLTYRFYRDTWEMLPDFDLLKFEDSGKIANQRISLRPASRFEAIGLVFEARLLVPSDGEYTFAVQSTDGARLTVNGQVVLERSGLGAGKVEGSIGLKAGLVPFRLDFFHGYGPPDLHVTWTGPGVESRSLGDDVADAFDLVVALETEGEALLGREGLARYFEVQRKLDASRRTNPPEAGIAIMAIEEASSTPVHLLARGSAHAPGVEVAAAVPEVLRGLVDAKPVAAASGGSSGKRLTLANWLTDPANPLTARVLVNRLWQHHFGRGIVPTPNDFGKLGEPPTHPELLDWLASEFMARGWKLKGMHKLIMTSRSYRLACVASEEALSRDPSNQWFGRCNMRRLSAEEIRDSILAVTGELNLQTSGPSIYVPIPREVLEGQSVPGAGWGDSTPDQQARRSVYIHVKRSLMVPILESHDVADTDSSCPVRYVTTVPTQSLGMINGEFTHERAAKLGSRLAREFPDDVGAQVRRAIRLTTLRDPDESEVAADLAFVRSLQAENQLSEVEALRIYCLLALNTNEFVYLD